MELGYKIVACYKPLTAWYSKELNPTGKRSLVFSSQGSLEPGKPLEIPCGQCIGCRLERSRQWAMRCMHETTLHEFNSFITLTFSPEELAKRDNPNSLDKSEYQRFMKRLRKKFKDVKIRYYHCGEYGDTYGRPHYHAILFGIDFADKEPWKEVGGNMYYISETLEELWGHGFCTIGEANFQSAAYVARYIMKKVNGQEALEHYNVIDPVTGEFKESLEPEYTTMSLKPGIGRGWMDEFKDDLYPKDFVQVNGKKMRPPKYYDRIMEADYPEEWESIKAKRKKGMLKAQEHDDCSIERLRVREKVQELRARKLVRNHDKEEIC